jgi:hypothetical protein
VFLDGIQVDLKPPMPRGRRLNVPDGIYHVMTRGNRKATIFERATAGLESAPEYLDLGWLLAVFPSASLEEAQAHLRRYVEAPVVDDAEAWLGRPLIGSSEFEGELRRHIDATLFMASLPRSYRAVDRPALGNIFESPVTKAERNRQMLRAHVVYAYRLSEIARALCIHPASVSRIVAALRRRVRNCDKC